MNLPTVDVEQGTDDLRLRMIIDAEPECVKMLGPEHRRSKRSPDWGLGMIGMHERARACGLTLRVKSIPGEGTTEVLHIPAGASL